MSLNWSVADCDNYKELLDGDEWQFTNAIIFLTMGVGMSKITEKNVDEFTRRAIIWQACAGPSMSRMRDSIYITEEHIRRRIGLGTNADRKTMTEFMHSAARAGRNIQLRETENAMRNLAAARAEQPEKESA